MRDGIDASISLAKTHRQTEGGIPLPTASDKTSARTFSPTSEIGLRLRFETGFVSHNVSASGSIFPTQLKKNAYAFSNFFPGFSGRL